jgi:hypothetical protein
MSIISNSALKSLLEEILLSSENSREIKLRLLGYSYRGIHMIDTLKGVLELDDKPGRLFHGCSPNSSYDQHLS